MPKRFLSSILVMLLSIASTSYIFPQSNLRSRERVLVVTVTPKDGSTIIVDGIKQGEGGVVLKNVTSGTRRVEAKNSQYDFILTRDVVVERGNLITVKVDFIEREVTVKTEPISSQSDTGLPPEDSADLADRKTRYETNRIMGHGDFFYSQEGEEFGRFELAERTKDAFEAREEYDKHSEGILLSYLGGIATVIGLVLFSEGAFEYSRNFYPDSDLGRRSNPNDPEYIPGLKALEIIGGLGIMSLNIWLIVLQSGEAAGHLDLAVEKYNRSLRRDLNLTLSETAY